MSNEIKIDSVATNPYSRYNTQTANEGIASTEPVAGVQISNTVNNLVGGLSQSSEPEIDDKRVDAIIGALKNGQYNVDFKQLAQSLVVELINNSSLPIGPQNGSEKL